jgi:serine/threonine protein kinase
MFHKYPPFEGTSIFEIREKMLNIEKNLHFSTQNSLINKLIRKILKFNPEERPTIDEIILEPVL